MHAWRALRLTGIRLIYNGISRAVLLASDHNSLITGFSSAVFRATFSSGLLWKLPANGFLLYQRAKCLLLLEFYFVHYTELDGLTSS
jgi:hypothetical protein